MLALDKTPVHTMGHGYIKRIYYFWMRLITLYLVLEFVLELSRQKSHKLDAHGNLLKDKGLTTTHSHIDKLETGLFFTKKVGNVNITTQTGIRY